MTITSGGTCAICGNFYDKAFSVTTFDGATSVFDSIECAAMWLAPECETCRTRILGHGVESDEGVFCSAFCAQAAGDERLIDRADAHYATRTGPDIDG